VWSFCFTDYVVLHEGFLTIVMDNYRNLLLVLINLPFALVGGVLVVLASGGEFSLARWSGS
jgi:Cu/Ag efflux pump CusA